MNRTALEEAVVLNGGERLTGKLRTSALFESSLARFIERLLARLCEAGDPAEVLLHLPVELTSNPLIKSAVGERLRSSKLYMFRLDAVGGSHRLKVMAELPPKHSLRREVLLVTGSCDLCATLTARPFFNGDRRTHRNNLWEVTVSFDADDVAGYARLLEARFTGDSAKFTATHSWLGKLAGEIQKAPERFHVAQHWGEVVTDVAFGLDERWQQSERRLKWFRMISLVQEAVGWELNIGRLFEATADVLKKTIGFDYIEMQFLEHRGKRYEATAVHHRNDTSFGGPLLTIILKPEAQSSLLRGRKPMLVKQANSAKLLMNPRLMGFMGFRSGVLVPLIFQRRPNGLLKLLAQKPGHFGPEDLPAMEAIGKIMARSIENVKTHTTLRRMATVDGLTNIFNRRFAMEQLSREFKRAKRYQSKLTLIMADIDHFKWWNDTFGHLKGDQILNTLASILKSCVREVDMVARYGGEEFIVILPEANLKQGFIVAEKIRKAVEQHQFRVGDKVADKRRVTISLGVATNSTEVETVTELVNRADQALYKAKRDGRNQTVSFSAGLREGN